MDQADLHQLEEQCIQEHFPACTAECPARVDMRGICIEIEKGEFSSGLKILKKTIPFPGIISRICDQPCRLKCVRKDAGDPISIAELEKACVAYGGKPDGLPVLPKRSNRLAVIGGGLFGLTTAIDLSKKGYQVTVFEKSDVLGGSLHQYDRSILPVEQIIEDFNIFHDLGTQIKLNTAVENITPVESEMFEINGNIFDAVLIATGANSTLMINLEMSDTKIRIDPVTYAASIPGIFSGGTSASGQDEIVRNNLNSPIFILSDGHRAATSIDRYFQHVSMTASRIKEGSVETRLFTSVIGISVEKAVERKKEIFSKEEAMEEASRCLKCQCLECVKVCEYLKEYGSYPKRYVREIYNNLSIVKGERRKNQFINSCSLCGLCGEVCPTDMDMGKICLDSRREMVKQNRMPASAHDFALRDMRFSNSERISLVRNAPGKSSSEFLFFPGCQLSASNPDYVEKLYKILREMPELSETGSVGLALRCCGAPARWAGRDELFQNDRDEFLAEYARCGKPELIIACSSCYQVFKEEYPDIRIQSLWTILDSHHVSRTGDLAPHTFAIHDPCTTRYETRLHDSIRNLVSSSGYQIEELPLSREKTECCSYGGLMWLANRPLSQKVINRRINESPHPYLTYCVMCRDFFLKQGKPAYHILDLLFNPSLENFTYSPPDYSERHANRENLRKRLLQDVWDEKMSDNREPIFNLRISEDVKKILEERLILEEDIQNVLRHASATGLSLVNPATKHLLAYFCPAYVTYWVEYSLDGDTYTIHNAYSHRMTIVEGERS